MFEIQGTIEGIPAQCIWKKGKLTGNKIALEKAKTENKKNHGLLGLIPSTTSENYLDNEFSAGQLIYQFVFDEGATFENDWEEEHKSSFGDCVSVIV